mgnify:CR=1 FL=1
MLNRRLRQCLKIHLSKRQTDFGVADSEYELTFADPDASGGIFSIHTAIQQRPDLKTRH